MCKGLVVPITEVTQAVDLVPIFSACVDHKMSATISQEAYNNFYLNYYTD